MVALDLSRTIKDGPDGCLIGAEEGVVQGLSVESVRRKTRAYPIGKLKALCMSDDYSEQTKGVKRGRLTLLKIRAMAAS